MSSRIVLRVQMVSFTYQFFYEISLKIFGISLSSPFLLYCGYKWWMESGFLAKTTTKPQVTGNFLTYPCWDSNSDAVRDSEQSVAIS